MKAQPRYSREEFARRGDEIYERALRRILERGNEGKFVAIDIETGDYEIDPDELAASDRLLAQVSNAQIWLRRIGSRYAYRFSSAIANAMIAIWMRGRFCNHTLSYTPDL